MNETLIRRRSTWWMSEYDFVLPKNKPQTAILVLARVRIGDVFGDHLGDSFWGQASPVAPYVDGGR